MGDFPVFIILPGPVRTMGDSKMGRVWILSVGGNGFTLLSPPPRHCSPEVYTPKTDDSQETTESQKVELSESR